MGVYRFRLPDVGEGVAEAEIVAWHVAPGQAVTEDQLVADVMTEKATVEISSPVAGRVLKLGHELGVMAPIGSTLIEIEVDGPGNADNLAAAPSLTAPPPAKTPPVVEHKPVPPVSAPAPAAVEPAPAPQTAALPPAPVSRRQPGEKPLASPAVRRRAEDAGIKLAYVQGSGPAGRITHADLDAYLTGETGVSRVGGLARRDDTTEIRVVGLRRRIAERMALAKRRIAHFSYVEETDVTDLEALRVHLNAEYQGKRPKLTLLPFLIRVLVRALAEFPQLNATYDDEAGVVTRYGAVHLGMATQTDAGLMVPVIRHAESLDLWQLAEEIVRLAQAARDGTAVREELSGSTITLTSLGPLGGLAHTPVINHPEVAILGPNRIVERPVVKDGNIVVRKMMNISGSFDHRVVDGYDAAHFVQRVKRLIENPASIFIA